MFRFAGRAAAAYRGDGRRQSSGRCRGTRFDHGCLRRLRWLSPNHSSEKESALGTLSGCVERRSRACEVEETCPAAYRLYVTATQTGYQQRKAGYV